MLRYRFRCICREDNAVITVPEGFDYALLISDLLELSLPFLLASVSSIVFLLAVAAIRKARP